MTIEYVGGCHCGGLGVRYRTALAPGVWAARSCQCRFCRAHGSVTCSDPAGLLWLSAFDASAVQHYHFGTGAVDFWICGRCGVYIGASIQEGYGIVNIRSLRPMPENVPEALPVMYEDESAPERLARRLRVWTPLASA